ncbi:MAG: tyrosine-type recombinase/integrase [Nocardioidaceae bacterium]
MASINKRPNGTWRARYRDDGGREHARHFRRKTDAQAWIDEQTAKLVAGAHVTPRLARTTVGEWCDTWIEGYRGHRPTTVRQAEVHITRIRAEFGTRRLSDVRPSHVRTWCANLAAEGLADSYVYALHARLSQLFADAVHDGLVAKSPCSRRTSPAAGKQRAYVATTEQVWALHDAMPEHLRAAVLLGAFAGLRLAEACGLRVTDVDFMRGLVTPAVQYRAEPLKSETSQTSIPVGQSMAIELSAHVQRHPSADGSVLIDQLGRQLAPWTLERAMRAARSGHVKGLGRGHAQECAGCLVPGLPADFRFHDLRHYFASLLIASGADVKVVQARVRHASAKTTLDTYGHLWPDSEERTAAAIDAALAARTRSDEKRTAEDDEGPPTASSADLRADSLRTAGGPTT